jgi:hypothetical protein
MFPNQSLLEGCQIQTGFSPGALGVAKTGTTVQMTGYGRLLVLFHKGIGTIEPPTLTLLQGKDLSMTGSKDLTFTDIWVKQDPTRLQDIPQWTHVTQAAGNSYADATTGPMETLWAIDIKATDLDINNGFCCVQASTSEVASGDAVIGDLLYIAYDPVNSTMAENMAGIVVAA